MSLENEHQRTEEDGPDTKALVTSETPKEGDKRADESPGTKYSRPREQRIRPNRVLGVFGLSPTTRDDKIRDIFTKHGIVESVEIVFDQSTGKSKCFAFVYMHSIEEAQRALEATNDTELDGRRIRVDFSATEKPHSPTPGRYMGRRTFSYSNRMREGFREPYSRPPGYGYRHRPSYHYSRSKSLERSPRYSRSYGGPRYARSRSRASHRDYRSSGREYMRHSPSPRRYCGYSNVSRDSMHRGRPRSRSPPPYESSADIGRRYSPSPSHRYSPSYPASRRYHSGPYYGRSRSGSRQ